MKSTERTRQWLVASCAAGVLATSHGAWAQDIKLGVHTTLSGPASTWGKAMVGAAELAAEDANSKGGLEVGGKKYKVTVTAYDDNYKANDAVTAMNRLISDDDIRFVVGPLGSAPALAVLPMTTEAKAITMTMAFSPKVIGKEFPFSFRPVVTTEEFAEPQIAWAVKKLGAKRVGGLFPNDETGQQMALATVKAYEKAGANFDAKEFFERDRTDFVPLLTRLFAQKIDTIDLTGDAPTTAGLIVKQAREMGFKGSIIRTGGDATADIVKVAGIVHTEGLYVHQPINPADPKVAAYSKRFTDKYKVDMNAFSPMFFANVQMLFMAMQKAASTTDVARIGDAMAALSGVETVVGKVGWTGEARYGVKRQIEAPFYIGQIRSGQSVIVAKCGMQGCE